MPVYSAAHDMIHFTSNSTARGFKAPRAHSKWVQTYWSRKGKSLTELKQLFAGKYTLNCNQLKLPFFWNSPAACWICNLCAGPVAEFKHLRAVLPFLKYGRKMIPRLSLRIARDNARALSEVIRSLATGTGDLAVPGSTALPAFAPHPGCRPPVASSLSHLRNHSTTSTHTSDRTPPADDAHRDGDIQAQVLAGALRHVPALGWSTAALREAAAELDLSPAVVGSFPRKEAELVEYFNAQCTDALEAALAHRTPPETAEQARGVLIDGVKQRLEMVVPFLGVSEAPSSPNIIAVVHALTPVHSEFP